MILTVARLKPPTKSPKIHPTGALLWPHQAHQTHKYSSYGGLSHLTRISTSSLGSWKGYKMGKRERKCEEEIKMKEGGDDLEGGEEPGDGSEGHEKGGKVG